jgi:hypothetical protein
MLLFCPYHQWSYAPDTRAADSEHAARPGKHNSAVGETLLKLIDEYNYAKFTVKVEWVGAMSLSDRTWLATKLRDGRGQLGRRPTTIST